MSIFFDKKPKVGNVSLVGILETEFPLSHGNYFGLMINNKSIPVANMNFENFEEAIKRFNIETLKFELHEFTGSKCITIMDERIPQDWYHLWTMGYANGGLNELEFERVNLSIGERFGGKVITVSSNLLNNCLKDLASRAKVEAIKFYFNLMGNTVSLRDASEYINNLLNS